MADLTARWGGGGVGSLELVAGDLEANPIYRNLTFLEKQRLGLGNYTTEWVCARSLHCGLACECFRGCPSWNPGKWKLVARAISPLPN